MPAVDMILREVEETQAKHLLSNSNKKNTNVNQAVKTLTIIAGLSMLINIDSHQQLNIIELETDHIINHKHPLRYKERTKGDLVMNNPKNNHEMGNIMDNLNTNPFYKKSNMDLLKEIKITGHLTSETPYVPIKSLKLNNGHLLKGDKKI
ncbi:MAG: hypothetical protein ACQEXE_10525 [Bacillota bacterium]